MAPKRYSIESGLGGDYSDYTDSSSSNCNSGVRDFFESFVPQLESEFRRRGRDADLDDPTIDMEFEMRKDLVFRPPSPIQHAKYQERDDNCIVVEKRRTNDETFQVKDNLNTQELDLITEQIKRKSNYGNKLMDIMLEGLEKTLPSELYRLFALGRLPDNWLPIVRMNNQNTPYVEFLIKSDIADQAPDSQLRDYTIEHLAFSKYIIDCLISRVNANSIPDSDDKPLQLKGRRLSNEDHPSCSTPISIKNSKQPQNRKRAVSQPKKRYNLNDSKRVLPSRACKANTSIGYRD